MAYRNRALDGVRGLAILLIVAAHSGISFRGSGFPNHIFLVLSGFLSTAPFSEIEYEQNFYKVSKWLDYYYSKAFRLLPAYLFALTMCHWFPGFLSHENYIKNLLFIDCWGDYWFIQQIVVFSLFVPIIMMGMAFIKHLVNKSFCNFICSSVAFIVAIAYQIFAQDFIVLRGNGLNVPLKMHIFLMGISVGYIYKGLRNYHFKGKTINIITDICVGFLFSSIFIPYYGYVGRIILNNDLLEDLIVFQISCCCLFVVLNKDALFVKLLNNRLLVFVGKISYSIYLINDLIIIALRSVHPELFDNPLCMFLLGIFVIIGFAFIIYILIEKPCDILRKTKKIKNVMKYYTELFET